MLYVLRPSRAYLTLLLFTHLAAAIVVSLTELHAWARFCLVLLIVASLFQQWHRHVNAGWQSFVLERDRLRIRTRSGRDVEGSIQGSTLVMPCCISLCARLEGRRFSVCQMIFWDALSREAHRELRVRLRYAQ